jgi:uncharacterized protein (TIGR02996 family)
MSDEKALLAAIWEHPHEDTPRLMFADWLQENGQDPGPAGRAGTPGAGPGSAAARAEFIRVQCELAPLDEWDERRPALERREKKLWKKFEKDWRKSLPTKLRDEPFHRGFVAPRERRFLTGQFCALAASTFEAAPLWNCYFDGTRDGLSGLARCPHLRHVGELKFWLSPTTNAASKVLGSPHLRNVRTLSLGHTEHWGRGLPALAENAGAENLTELDINEGLDDASAALIASSPGFAKLRKLSAYRHEVKSDGLRALFGSPHLAGLTELVLPAWYGEEGARAIAESRPAFRLRKLVMYGARLPDAGAALVANWPGLESVRAFHISGFCEVLGPRALAASPYAVNLRELDISLSRLGRPGALALARSKTLNLTKLIIRQTPAAEDETAVAALVKRFGKDAVKKR